MHRLRLELKDSLYRPETPRSKAQFKRRQGEYLYKVYLYLEGQDLPYVRSVTYRLHRTFRNPHKRVERTVSTPHCELVVWTWGLFHISADVTDKSGVTHTLEHYLKYDREIPGASFEEV